MELQTFEKETSIIYRHKYGTMKIDNVQQV